MAYFYHLYWYQVWQFFKFVHFVCLSEHFDIAFIIASIETGSDANGFCFGSPSFWNKNRFSVAIARGSRLEVLCKKDYSEKFSKIYRKTPSMESKITPKHVFYVNKVSQSSYLMPMTDCFWIINKTLYSFRILWNTELKTFAFKSVLHDDAFLLQHHICWVWITLQSANFFLETYLALHHVLS